MMMLVIENASAITKTCVAEFSELGHRATKSSAEFFNAVGVCWSVTDLMEGWKINQVGSAT